MKSRTEQILIDIRDEAMRVCPEMPKAMASKIALACAAVAVQHKAPMEAAGYKLKVDKAELVDVLDRICAQGER